MRILHILHQYLPEHVGGTEHYSRTLALAQAAVGHQVTILCRRRGVGQQLDREMLDGLPIYRLVNGSFSPSRRFLATMGDRFLAKNMKQVASESAPELIHIHHLMGLPANTLTAVDPAVPIVATLHDYWWICANANLITDYGGQLCAGPRWWLNCARCGLARVGVGIAWPLTPLLAPIFGWRNAVLRNVMTRVTAWIAPTAFVADWYTARGFPADRMHVVAHGIEPPPDGLSEVLESSEPEGAVHFAYIGGLALQKGVHVLVDAFNQLPSSARLTVAGDEMAFPAYCADLRQRAKHPGIRFAGRLERKGVWHLLSAADALVVPSLSYETASLVVQEAFAVGTPVVTTSHGALAERVHHEVDGLHVPPGNVPALHRAMRRLMDDPDLLSRLRRGISPPMDMDEHVRRLEAVYRQVVPT